MKSRSELMKLLYETKDPDHRLAISKRIAAVDRAQADKASEEALAALDKPLRMVKKAVSGSEDEWIAGGFQPEYKLPGMSENASEMLYDIGGGITDVVADPLNVIGTGLFTKGAKAVKKLAGADSGKGMLSANLDNYIPDFYGTGGRDLTRVEKMVGPAVKKYKPNIPDELLGDASAKVVGTAKAMVKGGARAAKSLVSPSDRALWKGTGISKGGQDVIKGHLKGGDRGQAKAVAEANYQLHNAFQGGRKGATHPALEAVGKKSNLETYTPNDPGTIEGWMGKHAGSHLDDSGKYVPNEMSQADAKYIEDHVMRDWDGADGIVMKKPASKQSGDHRNDALSAKNPSVGGINRSFAAMDKADTPKTVDNLLAELEKQKAVRGKKVAKDKKLSNYDVLGADETGVWLRTSKPGSAITEGGVNILTKVTPEGEYFSIVSDKHDFLEKVPVLGKAVSKYLPNDLVAVTPPMYAHVYKKPLKEAGKTGKSPYRLSSTEIANANKKVPDSTWNEDLAAIANARPDDALVRAEELKQAGGMMVGANEFDKER